MSATPMRVLQTCQIQLAWLFEAGFTAYYDTDTSWDYVRKTSYKGSEEITAKSFVFCSNRETYENGLSAGARYFLSLIAIVVDNTLVCFPIHGGLWYIQPSLTCLSTLSISFYDFPGFEEEYLCFNGSKLGNIILLMASKDKWGESTIIAVKADDLTQGLIVKSGTPGSTIYEDPRLFSYKGETYSAFTVCDPTKSGLGYCSVFPVIEPIIMPKYGKNLEMGPEKNWGFFEEDRSLYAVYSSYRPWTILKIQYNEVTVVREDRFPIEYKGPIHGGTCPKLVDGLWWIFGRVIDASEYPSIIVVAFEPKTFKIRGYAEPSFLTREALGMNLFHMGSAEYSGGIWECVGGWNEAKVFNARIPHSAIVKEMVWLRAY